MYLYIYNFINLIIKWVNFAVNAKKTKIMPEEKVKFKIIKLNIKFYNLL